MKRLAALLFLLCALSPVVPRAAGFGEEPDLAPPPGARLPLDLPLRDESGRALALGDALGGRPAVFALADYTCITLCGTALGLAAAALPETGLRPGADYRLLVLGLDPRDGPAEAVAMKRAYLGEGTAMAEAARFLVADRPAVAAVSAALGYRARYRPEADTFDHPLALMVLTGDGRLSAVLPGLGARPADLREALVAAKSGMVGGLAARVRLLCNALVAADGPRGAALRAAGAAGGTTALGLLGGAWLLLRRREPRA